MKNFSIRKFSQAILTGSTYLLIFYSPFYTPAMARTGIMARTQMMMRPRISQVNLTIDGQTVALAHPAVMYRGRIMVPLRGVFENLGATVNYDSISRQITARRSGTDIVLALGGLMATINGETRPLDVAPLNADGTVMVPLRFVSEALGAQVTWQAGTRTVSIVNRPVGIDVVNLQGTLVNPSETRLITGISLSPHAAMPGQTVTVTLTGTPDGTATFRIGNDQKFMMRETSPGTYTGTYTIPSGLEGRYLDLVTNLTLSSGQSNTLTSSAAIWVRNPNSTTSLPGGILPLQVISPNPAARVPQTFDVTGKTEPNAVVRLRLLTNQNDEIYSSQSIADAQGNYHFQIDTGKLRAGTHLIMQVHSENTAGKSSNETRIELTRQ